MVFAGIYARLIAALLGIEVTSWYRSKEDNVRVGGNPNSFHLRGLALDFRADTSEELIERFRELTGWQIVDERTNWGTGSGPHWHVEYDGPDKGKSDIGGLMMAGTVGLLIVAKPK